MNRAQATYLADGQRLHLHHGPIDMIVGVEGAGRAGALTRAAGRFDTLLDELVAELPVLRARTGPRLSGETARLMRGATQPFARHFITPMAAVAGAGADTILQAVCAGPGVDKAYVNNGGDVAFHIAPGQSMTTFSPAAPQARIRIGHADPVRGIATSGWRGRSHSRGIADAVTVLANSAAAADAAATMIANAVDLPDHPAITRASANTLFPDSDLGPRPVTVDVGPLTDADIGRALGRGVDYARTVLSRGLITGAILTLAGRHNLVGAHAYLQQKDPAHA